MLLHMGSLTFQSHRKTMTEKSDAASEGPRFECAAEGISAFVITGLRRVYDPAGTYTEVVGRVVINSKDKDKKSAAYEALRNLHLGKALLIQNEETNGSL